MRQSLLARKTDAHGRNDSQLKQARLGLAQRHGDGFDEYRPEHSSAFENRDIVIEAEYIDNSEQFVLTQRFSRDQEWVSRCAWSVSRCGKLPPDAGECRGDQFVGWRCQLPGGAVFGG